MSEEENTIEEENNVPEVTESTFANMNLSKEIQDAVAGKGYTIPTPIQAKSIPYLLDGRDLLGVAQTGTGKTAAFALPLLSNIDTNSRDVQILCLAPTRELAIQVSEAFEEYAKNINGFKALTVYGGTDFRGQLRSLERGVHVVVGTPGRVMDHIRRGTLKLKNLKTLVLDEADEMLRMGFIDDVEWILEHTPENHQTALFSATMPPQIKKIIHNYLNDPAEVTIKQKTTTAETIKQSFIQLRNNEKTDILARILEVEDVEAMLVFVKTKRSTLEVAEQLQARGFSVEALNGDIPQNQREKTVARLKNGNIDIIVGTDVAARGLDVGLISHVINYDSPQDNETYVHRIGRTGRAGRKGNAIIFVNVRETRVLKSIERTTRQKIELFKFPSIEELNKRKITSYFEKINTEMVKDLGEYKSLIKKYMSEFEVDPLLLAAAALSLANDSKDFYVKEMAKRTPQRSERSSERERDGGGRRDRERNRDRDGGNRRDNDRGRRKENQFEKAAYGQETFRMEIGESHGITKRDIVGAIANEGGIDSKDMGKIHLYEDYSLINLPEGMPKEIFTSLKKTRVRGQLLRISKDAGGDSRSNGNNSYSNEKRNSQRSGDFGKRGRSERYSGGGNKPHRKSRRPRD